MTQYEIARILDAIAALGRDQQVTAAAVVRLETKVEGIGADNVRADAIHADQESRIRANEHYISQQTGEANSVTKARAVQLAVVCSTIGGGLGFILSHIHW